MLGDDRQNPVGVGLAGELDVEVARLQLEQLRQKPGVIDIQAVG